MNKLKEIINKPIRKSYVVGVIVVSLLALVMYSSYALFTISVEKKGALNIVAGNLYTNITSNDIDSNNRILINGKSSKTIEIEIENINSIEARVNLYYKVNTEGKSINVGYSDEKDKAPEEVGYNLKGYGESGSKKTIKITLQNTNEENIEVEFGTKIGLKTNNLSIPSLSYVINEYEGIANSPELDEGMIPIYYDGNTAKKADITTEWYNYKEKKWANAIMVSEATRSSYKNAKAGTIIKEEDVLGYLVWIPRYKYKLFNVEGEVITPQTIKVIFEDNTTIKSNGSTNGEYLTHPGFTFGSEELNGMWVGKFETTGDATTPTIKPNTSYLKSQNISSYFEISKKFVDSKIYGITGDAHISKTSEWSTLQYLSHSKYGLNGEITKNGNSNYLTGCASTDNGTSTTCEKAFGGASDFNYLQSTTGNITGVFDASGGGIEYTMGVLVDNNGNPRSGNNSTLNSGFTGLLADNTMYTGKNFPEVKYYDLFQSTNFLTACNGPCLGYGMAETKNWYGDWYLDVVVLAPWIVKGGSYTYTDQKAGIFTSVNYYGEGRSYNSFRLVITK